MAYSRPGRTLDAKLSNAVPGHITNSTPQGWPRVNPGLMAASRHRWRFSGTACDGCPAERTLVKVREMLKLLRADGWTIARIRGSHRQLTHPVKRGTVTVAGKRGDDLGPKTIRSILRQAELEP
jgi:predicted RNA binding protein YcfA (HicA-like mRNA interferase family)